MTPPKDVEQEVRRHSALVWSIVRRYAGTGRDPDDLFQIGAIGLIKALEGFNESFGTCFSTYAVPKIAGEIRRFLRDDGTIKVSRLMKEKAYALAKARREFENKNGREPTLSEISAALFMDTAEAAACMASSEAVLSLDSPMNEDGLSLMDLKGDESAEEKMLERLSLKEAMDKLDELEKKVIALRYYKDLTQQKTADILGISQVKVSRTEKKALEKMRKKMT